MSALAAQRGHRPGVRGVLRRPLSGFPGRVSKNRTNDHKSGMGHALVLNAEGEVVADTNRGVVYQAPGRVTVEDLDFPRLELAEQDGRQLQHGAILKVLATNICGSDQHMVRGRTTAPGGLTLGHEITGEVIETGRDVEFAKRGDLVSVPEVDAAVDCVGFEARGHGPEGSAGERPATVLNTLMEVTRAAGGVGIPGLYVTGDPGAADENARVGRLGIQIGLGWARSQYFVTGQCPVMSYNRQLMMAILHDRVRIARNVNASVIPLDQAPEGYAEFDRGAARKYILDPHGVLGAAA